MSQDVYTLAEFKDENGKPFRRRVIISMDRVPLEASERLRLINEKLDQSDYRLAPPTIGETTQEAASGLGRTLLEMGPTVVGIGLGATRGAAIGAPAGPLPAFLTGIGGAILGGITGRATTETGKALMGETPMPIPQQLYSGTKTALEAEAYGLPFRALGAMTSTIPLPGVVPMAPNTPSDLARLATARAARARGIDLTAAEQSGNTILRLGEVISERSVTGAGTMRAFGEKQAGQLIGAGEKIGSEYGPATDIVTRSNRFLTAVQGRIDEMKSMASAMFEKYVQSAGPRSPVPLDPLFQTAFDIRGNLPLFQSLKNPKLTNPGGTGLLDEIQTLKAQGFTTLPLEEVRKLKTAIGDIAFPSRLEGSVTVDAPVAAARRLYGSLNEALKANATATNTLPLLQEANQFESQVIHGALDSRFYKSIVEGEKTLGSLGKTLFNVRDPQVLMDAKAVLNPEGWKLLQQHYWDETFTPMVQTTEGGTKAFLGSKFADKVEKDLPVLKILYTPEQASAIQEFASIARLASRSSQLRQSDVMGILVGGGQVYLASRGLQNLLQGDIPEATFDAMGFVAPYFAAKVFTNPTTAQMLTSMIKRGAPVTEAATLLGQTVARLEAARENVPQAPTHPETYE